MQLKITLRPQGGITIPINYNHQLQSAIYAKLRQADSSDFWHNTGFRCERCYKAFVFGKLSGHYTLSNKQLTFHDDITFEVRSPLMDFCDPLQRSIELDPRIKLFDQWVDIIDVRLANRHINSDTALFATDSPVVIHATNADGSTTFFGPEDESFTERLLRNYERKYTALTGEAPDAVTIECPGTHRRVVTRFKSTWLTGWAGLYRISGSTRALEFIYNTGLGSNNSQGFGLLEIK